MANDKFFFLEPIVLTEEEAQAGFDNALRRCTQAQYIAFRDALDRRAKEEDAADAASKTLSKSVDLKHAGLRPDERSFGGHVPKPTKDYERYWITELEKVDRQIAEKLDLRRRIVIAYQAITEDTKRHATPPQYLIDYLATFASDVNGVEGKPESNRSSARRKRGDTDR